MVGINVAAQNPDAVTNKMSDEELRAFRDQKVNLLKQRARQVRREQTSDGTVYSGIFFCTVYYTPMESGFTAER